MNNNQTKYTKQHPSNKTPEILSMEPNTEEQKASGDSSIFFTSFTSPIKNSNSVIEEAKFDTEKRNLEITLANCNLISVGQSNTLQEQFNCNCYLHDQHPKRSSQGKLQAHIGPKTEDCSLDQQTTATALGKYHLQPFVTEARDSKQAVSGEIFIVSIGPQPPLIKKQGYLKGPQCEQILGQLELLQDGGNFEAHERLVTRFICRFGDGKNADMELALKMERGVAYSYQKEFKISKRMFTSVIKSEKNQQLQATNENILKARAYILRVADYRRKKCEKLSQLFEILRQSEYLLQNHDSPEDWAELYMNYGCVWLIYMSIIPDDQRRAQARNAARAKARDYFEQAFSICKTDPRLRVQIKKQTYSRLKLAELILDCTSTSARAKEKAIPPNDIMEAIEHLDYVQYQLGDSVPTGTRIQLLKTRSDQFYRQGIYQLAKETAEKAFQLASSNGFHAELDSLQERIKYLNTNLDKAKPDKLIVITELEKSGSETYYSESE